MNSGSDNDAELQWKRQFERDRAAAVLGQPSRPAPPNAAFASETRSSDVAKQKEWRRGLERDRVESTMAALGWNYPGPGASAGKGAVAGQVQAGAEAVAAASEGDVGGAAKTAAKVGWQRVKWYVLGAGGGLMAKLSLVFGLLVIIVAAGCYISDLGALSAILGATGCTL